MALITKIEKQKKNETRCNLYLDGKFFASMNLISIMQNHLEEGKEINAKELDNLVFDNEKESAMIYATDYTCKYSSTSRQLIKKLYDKGYSKKIIDYVVDNCKKYGYINDLLYAKNYVIQFNSKKGKIKIENELKAKGIDSSLIEEAMKSYEDNDGCYELLIKKSKNKDLNDVKQLASVVRFLQSRGYEWSQIKEALDRLNKNIEI